MRSLNRRSRNNFGRTIAGRNADCQRKDGGQNYQRTPACASPILFIGKAQHSLDLRRSAFNIAVWQRGSKTQQGDVSAGHNRLECIALKVVASRSG